MSPLEHFACPEMSNFFLFLRARSSKFPISLPLSSLVYLPTIFTLHRRPLLSMATSDDGTPKALFALLLRSATQTLSYLQPTAWSQARKPGSPSLKVTNEISERTSCGVCASQYCLSVPPIYCFVFREVECILVWWGAQDLLDCLLENLKQMMPTQVRYFLLLKYMNVCVFSMHFEKVRNIKECR